MHKKGNRNLAIGLGLAVLIGIVVAAGGFGTNPQQQQVAQQQQTQTQQPFTPPQQQELAQGCALYYCGDVKANISNINALNEAATSLTEATNVDTTWWRSIDGGTTFTKMAGGDAKVWNVDSRDGGFVYSSHAITSGQSYFLDVDQTTLINSRFVEYRYFDINKDGSRDHVYKWSVADLNPIGGGETAKSFYINARWYVAGTPSFSTAPADQTGIGTTAATAKFINWDLKLDADTKASLIYEIELKINSTSTAKWDRGQSTIDLSQCSGGKLGKLDLQAYAESQDGTNTFYKYTISSTGFDNDIIFKVGKNASNLCLMQARMVWNLATSDVLTTTLSVRYHTAALGSTTISDAVNNSA